jgi:hypothetical protein
MLTNTHDWLLIMFVIGIEIFGFVLPLWLFFLIFIIAAIILWKLIKFAIKLLIVVVVFFIILFGLDILGIFDMIDKLIASAV